MPSSGAPWRGLSKRDSFPPQVALAPDGRVAIRDNVGFAVVYLIDGADKCVLRLAPYGPQPVEWLGWTADGKLLTVGTGKLTAWDADTGKARFETAGSYTGVAALAPGREWIALAAPGVIDIVDTASGACRGRLQAWETTLSLAVSPDGTRLAALGPARHGAGVGTPARVWTGTEPSEVPSEGWRQVLAWKVEDGTADGKATFRPVASAPLQWIGPRQLVAGGGSVADLDVGCGTYHFAFEGKGKPLRDSPDGRLWLTRDGWLEAVKPPALRPEGEVVFGPSVPLQVQVSGPSAIRAAQVAKLLNGVLRDLGQAMGEGGWSWRLNVQEKETQQKLSFGSQSKELPLPAVYVRGDLVAPDGTAVASTADSAGFLGPRSRYFNGRQDITMGPQSSWVEYYNFRGQDPKEAILDEEWEYVLPGCRFYSQGVVKVGTAYQPLPIKLPVQPGR